jgi:hypothetical protein
MLSIVKHRPIGENSTNLDTLSEEEEKLLLTCFYSKLRNLGNLRELKEFRPPSTNCKTLRETLRFFGLDF